MALRCKGERKPACYDTRMIPVLVDAGGVLLKYGMIPAARTADLIDKFLRLPCKEGGKKSANECKRRLKVKKDVETRMMGCVCHSALHL